ncbi:hypothetical protein [Treponema primitia]|uniref:hypothetical protein n=1 Tax=Treponema primitia TaxID=88058 RepID=UPI0005A20F58|nr:hypothetical protein [Treponema primitia]
MRVSMSIPTKSGLSKPSAAAMHTCVRSAISSFPIKNCSANQPWVLRKQLIINNPALKGEVVVLIRYLYSGFNTPLNALKLPCVNGFLGIKPLNTNTKFRSKVASQGIVHYLNPIAAKMRAVFNASMETFESFFGMEGSFFIFWGNMDF